MTTPDDITAKDLRRYLLGRLPAAQRDTVELRLLSDDDAYDAMLATEDDLLDAYVQDELGDAGRRAFEENVLPRAGIAERLAFARALQVYGAEQRSARSVARPRRSWSDRLGAWLGTLLPAPSPAFRLAAATLAVVLMATAGWFAWQNGDLARRVARLEAERAELVGEREGLAQSRERLARELAAARSEVAERAAERTAGAEELAAARSRVRELEQRIATLRTPQRQPTAASFLLALATRGAGTPELTIPDAAEVVRLQLDTAGDGAYHDAFRVRLLGSGGAQVWGRSGLAADPATGIVELELPGELLPAGRYEILLEGVGGNGGGTELVGAYEFQLRRSSPVP